MLTIKLLKEQIDLMLKMGVIKEDDNVLLAIPGEETFLVSGTGTPAIIYDKNLVVKGVLLFGRSSN